MPPYRVGTSPYRLTACCAWGCTIDITTPAPLVRLVNRPINQVLVDAHHEGAATAQG